MSKRGSSAKTGKSSEGGQATKLALADDIMRDDHKVLRALAQMSVTREVMTRRKRALRELSK